MVWFSLHLFFLLSFLFFIFLICLILIKVEFQGLNGIGGPLYIGTGCFHRRDTLCGRRYTRADKGEWKRMKNGKIKESCEELKKRISGLVGCKYEENTEWGKEVLPSLSLSLSLDLIIRWIYVST